MARQNRGQRTNNVFNSLVWRQQSECEQDGLAFGAELVFEIVGIHERQIRHAVWNHINLSARNCIHFAKKLGREFAHHNQAIRKMSDLFEDDALICIRIAQNRV